MGKFGTETWSEPEPDQVCRARRRLCRRRERRRIAHHRTAPQFIARTTRQQKARVRLFDQSRLRFRLRLRKFPNSRDRLETAFGHGTGRPGLQPNDTGGSVTKCVLIL